MPRPSRSFGRPGTRVIPDRWNTDHAPVAAATMRALVSLRHDAGATTKTYTPYDPANPDNTGRTTYDAASPYATDVPARIQGLREMTTRGNQATAEESLRVSGYLVTLPLDDLVDPTSPTDEPQRGSLIATGDIVTVIKCADPLLLLPGTELHVTDIVRGTERWERDLFCELVDTTGGGVRP